MRIARVITMRRRLPYASPKPPRTGVETNAAIKNAVITQAAADSEAPSSSLIRGRAVTALDWRMQ